MTRHLPFLLAIAILSAFALTPAAAQTAPCQAPAGRLRTLASRHPEIADLIGCPSSDETAITLSVQRFEHGWVLGERVPQSDSQVLTEVLFEDDQHYVRYDSPSPELANHDRARLGEPIGRAQVAPARGQFFEHGGMVWDPRTGSAFALVIRGVADQPDAERVWWLFTDQVTSSATRTPSSPPRTPSAVSRTPTRIPPTPTPTTPLAANAVVASAPGTLSGRVVWCTNGLPTEAPDVQVTVTGTLLSAITDSDGRFTLKGAPIDQYVIVGVRPLDEAKAMFSAVMPGVLASAARATDIGTVYLNMPDGNGCQSLPAVYG